MAATLTVTDLLREAADALDEAYRGRDDVPAATLALVAALGERADRKAPVSSRLEEPEENASTITQDEP